MRERTEIPRRMIKSLLITITVSQLGITLRMERVMKEVIINDLSARGSRKEPKTVFCLSTRARKPSRPSVMQAIINTTMALKKAPSIKKMTITGTRIILRSVNKLGIFMISFYSIPYP
jgi:hypothetical protein